ncbi:MAG: hypothetical protein ACTSRZ_15105 [Promethearchaeota archaeon]
MNLESNEKQNEQNEKQSKNMPKNRKEFSNIEEFILKETRKNLLISSVYQLFIPLFLIAIPYLVIFVLRLDLLPPFTIKNAPLLWTIASILIIIDIIQIIYAICLNKIVCLIKVDNAKSNKLLILKILGYIISIAMLINPPTGTYYGANFIVFLRNHFNNTSKVKYNQKYSREDEFNSNATKNHSNSTTNNLLKNDIVKNLGKTLFVYGIYLLHQPILLFLINIFLLALPLDMAHPIITSDLYDKIDYFAYAYLIIYIAQIILGYLIIVKTQKIPYSSKYFKAIIYFFAIFSITAICYLLGGLLLYLSHTLEFANYSIYFFLGGFALGFIFNPLGISFGREIIKIQNIIKL